MTTPLGLPPAVARCVDPEAPAALRQAIARGAVPLPPGHYLSALTALLADPLPAVRDVARSAWQDLPGKLLDNALGDPELPEAVLHLVANREEKNHERVFRVLAHPQVGPRTLRRLSTSTDPAILSRIARNQRLLDQHPEIARKLIGNAHLDPGERGLLQSLYGSDPEQPPLAPPPAAPATVTEVPPPAADDGELPPDVPDELLSDAEALGVQAMPSNLYQYVASLNVADKIKLAMVGSKGARRLLIRDTNKVVSTAVIRSPKIREDEVHTIAQDRTVGDEIVRIILTRKDWMKNYPIRLALAQNPKTPIPRALRLLDTLQERDLRQISKSRNVASPVSAGARRILARRGRG